MDQAEYKRFQKFIEPCLTPEDLDEFIQTNLGIEFPWDVVDEMSTSSSLKFLWKVNQTMITGKGAHRHVLAASRNSAKTLGSAVLQFIALLHFRRDSNHLASTIEQSSALIRYMDQFMRTPLLLPYQNTDNVRRKEFINLPPNDYTSKSNAALQVITASKKGANSSRCSFMTFDEVDLTPREILSEAAFILDPTRDGHRFDPISVYLSSRKTNNGPIQDLIDEAESTENKNSDDQIVLHKWSSVDWQEKCEDDVSLIKEGEFDAWLHTETLKTVWTKEEFDLLPENRKSEYLIRKSYKGCMECPAWISCQGRAVNQRGTSPMLRQRSFVGRILKGVKDPAQIIAQSLNWKPESSGLVFRMFSKFHHIKDYIDFYEWVSFGNKYDPFNLGQEAVNALINEGNIKDVAILTPTKDQIYDAMIENGWQIVSGVDFGHSPDPAVCVVVGYHKKADLCAILHVDYANGYANHRWAQYTCENTLSRFPVEWVGPDCADKSAPSYFAKGGVRSLQNKPSRIEPGVSFIRGMLWDAVTGTARLAILDDSSNDDKNQFVVDEFEKYAHARDVNGKILKDKYVDENNHAMDALRYALAPFADKVNITASAIQFGVKKDSPKDIIGDVKYGSEEEKRIALEHIKQKEDLQNQLKEFMFLEHGISNIDNKITVQGDVQGPKKKKKPSGGIKFSI